MHVGPIKVHGSQGGKRRIFAVSSCDIKYGKDESTGPYRVASSMIANSGTAIKVELSVV